MTAAGNRFDKILKSVLANPVCIRQLLQTYICQAEMSEEIDFGRMEQIGAEFVDPFTHRTYYGDMLWKIYYKDPDREPLYLVLLLELQSSSCRYMALRMNNYMMQFYLSLLRKSAKQDMFPLPQVLPVVFYTGWPKWSGPLDACELIHNRGADVWSPEPFYRFKFKLLDIPRLANKAEINSPLWLALDVLQTNKMDKLQKKRQNLKSLLPEVDNPLFQEALIQLVGIVYEHIKGGDMSTELSLETEYPQYTAQELDDWLDAEGNVISWRDRYFSEGRAEGKSIGLAEGKNIGLAEGIVKGQAEERLNNLKQVLYGKFSGITAEQVETVLQYRDEPNLFARIIKADSPEELLQALG